MPKPQTTPGRIVPVDYLRGVAILNMVAYHLLYDLVVFYGASIPLFALPGKIWQSCIGGGFIFLSGLSGAFSKNNLKRGIKLLAIALGLTAITYLFMPGAVILFGVLHLLAVAMIFSHILLPMVKKIPFLPGFFISILLFCLCYPINNGYAGLGFFKLTLPPAWYQNIITAVLGFAPVGFSSADYYPLLPWLFIFIAGLFAGVFLANLTLPGWVRQNPMPWLGFLGRHSLIIYLAHQPVLYAVLYLLYL